MIDLQDLEQKANAANMEYLCAVNPQTILALIERIRDADAILKSDTNREFMLKCIEYDQKYSGNS